MLLALRSLQKRDVPLYIQCKESLDKFCYENAQDKILVVHVLNKSVVLRCNSCLWAALRGWGEKNNQHSLVSLLSPLFLLYTPIGFLFFDWLFVYFSESLRNLIYMETCTIQENNLKCWVVKVWICWSNEHFIIGWYWTVVKSFTNFSLKTDYKPVDIQ